MEDVHEPASIRRYVSLLDGKIEIDQDLDGFEQNTAFPSTVDLDQRRSGAYVIVDHDSAGSKSEAKQSVEKARKMMGEEGMRGIQAPRGEQIGENGTPNRRRKAAAAAAQIHGDFIEISHDLGEKSAQQEAESRGRRG